MVEFKPICNLMTKELSFDEVIEVFNDPNDQIIVDDSKVDMEVDDEEYDLTDLLKHLIILVQE